jgi:hypothetical protein
MDEVQNKIMIDKELIFLLVYEESEFVTFSSDSPTPSGYTRKNEITKAFAAKIEMDKFIDGLKDKFNVKTYKTYHCFPTSKKIELRDYKPFSRSFNGVVTK